MAISYLWRALEEYGVSTSSEDTDRLFSQFFIGFEAVPGDDVLLLTDDSAWWEILGVEKSTTETAVTNAYRALAKIHHPDVGGKANDFKRIREAYDQGMATFRKGEPTC